MEHQFWYSYIKLYFEKKFITQLIVVVFDSLWYVQNQIRFLKISTYNIIEERSLIR